MNGLIVGDNFHQEPRVSIGRANGAHRISTVFRKQGIQVDVIDFFNSWTISELEEYVSRYTSLDFLGLSIGLSRLDSKLVNPLIALVKQKFPGIKVVAGGSDVLENDHIGVDLYFRGLAEGVIDELVSYIKTGTFNSKYVQEIQTHDNKRVVDCNLHFKDFDLKNLRTEYTEQDFIQQNEVLTLEVARGCVFKCSFCNFPFTGKKKNDYIRDKEDIKAELLENYQKYRATRYLITDDTFNDNPHKVDMMYEISQELDFKLSFMCYARVDLLHAKPDQLQKMYDFGVRGMFFGIESLKESTSRKIGKGFSGERLKKYLLEMREQYPEIHITTSFIVGLPDESIEEFKENIRWVVENKASDSIPLFSLNIPVDNKVNYISEFTENWRESGYEEMTMEEIANYENISVKQYNTENYLKNINDYVKHHVPWKNEHMNFIDAHRYNQEIWKEVRSHTSVSGWFAFANAFNSDNLYEKMFTKKDNIDWKLQAKYANDFIFQYKKNKLKNITSI